MAIEGGSLGGAVRQQANDEGRNRSLLGVPERAKLMTSSIRSPRSPQ